MNRLLQQRSQVKCVRRWWRVGGGPVRWCARDERVWARMHVIQKVRAVFGVAIHTRARITNIVFWTRAADS